MTLKEQITAEMDWLASDPRTVFVGYGLTTGRAMGTLKNAPESSLTEFPVAEGLMVSSALGMSLAGLLPVVYFERMDFMMNAMDAIVNHLLPAKKLSRNEFSPALIIRATVGNSQKPLFTGPVHTQDFSNLFSALGLLVMETHDYRFARQRQLLGKSTLMMEYKDMM